MSLNHKQVLEALLAGETLRDVRNHSIKISLSNTDMVDETLDILAGFDLDDWEIEPKTININGYEVPEPVKEPLVMETRYYLTDICSRTRAYTWRKAEVDFEWLALGIIHLTEEAAELHRKALVSFTSSNVKS